MASPRLKAEAEVARLPAEPDGVRYATEAYTESESGGS